jgi:alpha-galactosidase
MKPNRRIVLVLSMLAFCAVGTAKDIPAQLPRPDGKPGDSTKPVKVYILAGQSNMVGMGDITGARPPHPRVFLSADPAIIPGVTPVGAVDDGRAQDWVPVVRHGVFEAKAAVYPGPDDPAKPPLKTVAVALGTVVEHLPTTEGTQTVVVTALMDVPVTGNYQVHAGFGESTHNIVLLDGKEVYRKEVGGKPVVAKVALEQGKRYPVRITYFRGGSAAFWLERVDIPGKGDLETVTKKDKKFPYLLDDHGKWTVRNDVSYKEARLHPESAGSALSATSNNGGTIGPELGFGYVMGTFHDEQVLLIKTAQGNRSLAWDFRPPSSGKTNREGAEQFEGLEYRLMVKGVRETLGNIAKIVPGYQGHGYEIAGFGWFQGHKDAGSTKEEYEKHLVNLINDLRKEFNVPKMPAVVATVGFNGYRLDQGPWKGVWAAQMAVGDPKQHPEFAGTVASVDTRDFWREVEESPRGQDYHYNRNAETYLLVGEAMGRAMVRLEGGQAEAIPKSDREARVAAEVAAAAAKPVPTEEQKAASLAAVKPMILDGALAAFLSSPRYQPLLEPLVKGQRPASASPLLGDTLDEMADYYRAAGNHDYDWKPFGGDMTSASWDYFSFDLPKAQDDPKVATAPKAKVGPAIKITYPAGMENWFAPDFDAKKAGWKSGAAPFGQLDDKVASPDWAPRCHVPPKTLCEKDVLLMRQSFDIPPLKEGHRYRIRIAGSAHVNMGEGYAIYVNGKLLAESKGGIIAWRKQGHKPRGGHVWADCRDEFKGGKVTLAVANFPMDNRPPEAFIPHRAHLTVWMEEMKIPPLGEAEKAEKK